MATARITGILITLLSTVSLYSAQPKSLEQLQREFVDWRFGMYLHFGIETFTGDYWEHSTPPDGSGYTLAALDCASWARAAKAAGMAYAVLTAKHHYGFCLWNTSTTTYSCMNYGLKRDVVREYMDAFRADSLIPCLYYSILDAKHGVDGDHSSSSRALWNGKKEFILGQLRELLTNYGKIPLLVVDGWSWRNGHNNLPYQEIREFIKELQPECLVYDHSGVSEPWENDIVIFEEPKGVYAPTTNTYAATQEQTIYGNSTWFWKANNTPISTSSIVDHLNKLQERYVTFLLNCPPNRNGTMDQNIVSRLAEVGQTWQKNTTRAPLPAQPHVVEHPVTPVSALGNTGSSAWSAIDAWNDIYSATSVGQSLWTGSGSLPQSVILDLGIKYYNLEILTCLPRQDFVGGGVPVTQGNITGYNVYLSDDNSTFTKVAEGTWASDKTLKTVEWIPAYGRYVKIEATTAYGSNNAVINDITVGGRLNKPSTTPVGVAFRGATSQRARYDRTVFTISSGIFRKDREPASVYSLYDLFGRTVVRIKPAASAIDVRKNLHMPQKLYVLKKN
ncbi:MAG: alpha-L-fucosidase [Chitinispirillaceae bacterium]|nr:alpha-L-fucosidase [Chitinispirillaceae bacterium]